VTALQRHRVPKLIVRVRFPSPALKATVQVTAGVDGLFKAARSTHPRAPAGLR